MGYISPDNMFNTEPNPETGCWGKGVGCDGLCMNLDCIPMTSTELAKHQQKEKIHKFVRGWGVPMGILLLWAVFMVGVWQLSTYPARNFRESMEANMKAASARHASQQHNR